MTLLSRLVVLVLYFIVLSEANVTRVSKNDVLLSRRKRYLTFPMGSNLVISFSGVKAFFQVQPKGWNILVEMDVPFALPSDARMFLKNKKRHKMERRDVYSQLELSLTENGFNGTACVKRIMCDAQEYIPFKGKSLVKDLLLAVFVSPDSPWDSENKEICDDSVWIDCSVSFLDYILKSVQANENDIPD